MKIPLKHSGLLTIRTILLNQKTRHLSCVNQDELVAKLSDFTVTQFL